MALPEEAIKYIQPRIQDYFGHVDITKRSTMLHSVTPLDILTQHLPLPDDQHKLAA